VVDKRVDFTYTANGQYATINRYEDLTTTDLVAETTYTYDDQNRLTDLDHEKGATTLAGYDWTYDSSGRVTNFDSTEDGSVDYDYDDRGQVTSADYDYQTDESYTYDDNGNRTNTGYTTGYTTGDHNLTTSDGTYNYTYDEENNRTKRTHISSGDYIEYEWDNRNRLTGVKFYNSSDVLQKEVVYEYDVFDRRITKKVDDNGNSTIDRAYRYSYDESGKVDSNGHGHLDDIVFVFDESGDLINRHLHAPAVDHMLADEQFLNGLLDEIQWSLADNLGSVRDLVTYDDGTDTTR